MGMGGTVSLLFRYLREIRDLLKQILDALNRDKPQ